MWVRAAACGLHHLQKRSGVIYGGVAAARGGKLSCVPSCSTKSLLDLLDEHEGSSRELLLWRIDLKLAPASGPAKPRSAKVSGGVDVDWTRLC